VTSAPDPFARFAALFGRARESGVPEPTAVALATSGADGKPSARMVLLKDFDAGGFTFYTNLGSRKATEIAATGAAALCFHWQLLEAQVRIEGKVEPVEDEEADAYFATRPRGSQLGAWASRQSEPLGSMEELRRRVQEVDARFAGDDVPRPPFWSGFRVVPERIEFWQGHPDRLHERELYLRDRDAPGGWKVERLYP
jgi:pyridoxamine 5'-phosphate oxidase